MSAVISITGAREVLVRDCYRLAAKALVAKSLGMSVPDLRKPAFSSTHEPGTGARMSFVSIHGAVCFALAGIGLPWFIEHVEECGEAGRIDDYFMGDALSIHESERDVWELAAVVVQDERKQRRFVYDAWRETIGFFIRHWSDIERIARSLASTGVVSADTLPCLPWKAMPKRATRAERLIPREV